MVIGPSSKMASEKADPPRQWQAVRLIFRGWLIISYLSLVFLLFFGEAVFEWLGIHRLLRRWFGDYIGMFALVPSILWLFYPFAALCLCGAVWLKFGRVEAYRNLAYLGAWLGLTVGTLIVLVLIASWPSQEFIDDLRRKPMSFSPAQDREREHS